MGSKSESNTTTAGSGFQDVQDVNSTDVGNLQVYKSIGTDIHFSQTDHGAIEAAIDLVEDEAENTRIFSAGVVNQYHEALGGVLLYSDEQNRRNTEFTEGQLESNRIFSAGAIREVATNARAALAANADTVEKAFTLVGGGFSKFADGLNLALADSRATTESVSDFSKHVLEDLNEQATKNIKAVSDATRSDAANSLDKVVLLAGAAFVVLGVTTVYMRTR